MRVPYSWLRDHIDIDLPAEDVAKILTMSGLEVEEIDEMGKELEHIVVGEVVNVVPHPRAKNLNLLDVNTGEGKVKVVCGDKNIQDGMKVIYARPGITLPGGKQVEELEIRGENSHGMLCSAEELNLQEDAEGVMVLEKSARVGEAVRKYLELEDQIFGLDLTPNYGHALSIVGVARELAAVTGNDLKMLQVIEEKESGRVEDILGVNIEDPDLCPRYTARIIEGVWIGPSPSWMQKRLLAAGVRPVNNIVDITNYVMLEMGQPLHAFDFDKLASNEIVVRRAREGEKIVTLDDKERTLHEEMLIIADKKKPVALAGVMGGIESEVTEETHNVLLEAACFIPATVRKTARELTLHSPSSHRFERGVDIENIKRASLRAAQLMVELAGGELIGGVVDEYPRLREPLRLELRPHRVNQVLGTDIPRMEIRNILERLQFKVKDSRTNKEFLRVSVPSFRNDVEIEADLIEEVARIYGYERIPVELPTVEMTLGEKGPGQELESHTVNFFSAAGFDQVLTMPLVRQEEEVEASIKLQNYISRENAALRSKIFPGILRILNFNLNRQQDKACFFEISRVFAPRDSEQPREPRHLVACAMGLEGAASWYGEAPEFFHLKGCLEDYLESLNLQVTFLKSQYSFLHPGRQAEIMLADESLGFIGEVHPETQEKYQLQRTAIMEITLELLEEKGRLVADFRGVPRFPSITRDLALVVAENITAAQLMQVIREEGGDLLEELTLFDVYRGEQIPEDKKSLAFRMVFRSPTRTLTDQEVDERLERMVAVVAERYKGEIRK